MAIPLNVLVLIPSGKESPPCIKLSDILRVKISKVDSLASVALISVNGALRHYLRREPFSKSFQFRLFTTIHGHMLSDYDVIVLDGALAQFTLESYITRTHAHRLRGEKIRQLRLNPSSRDSEIADTRSFPDFAKLYDEYDFPSYAESTEKMLELANIQLLAWQTYLRSEAGCALIRVRNPVNNQFVAKRCILLPSNALANWRYQFNKTMKEFVHYAIASFSDEYIESFQVNGEMGHLFYVKRIGMDNKGRDKFKDIPFWKMEILLKKWRTDRALEEWGAKYNYQV